jgi:hypothetical protein
MILQDNLHGQLLKNKKGNTLKTNKKSEIINIRARNTFSIHPCKSKPPRDDANQLLHDTLYLVENILQDKNKSTGCFVLYNLIRGHDILEHCRYDIERKIQEPT